MQNLSRFNMFLIPIFFGEGQAPKFCDSFYKIEHTSRHVAKFYGIHPTDLKDLWLQNK